MGLYRDVPDKAELVELTVEAVSAEPPTCRREARHLDPPARGIAGAVVAFGHQQFGQAAEIAHLVAQYVDQRPGAGRVPVLAPRRRPPGFMDGGERARGPGLLLRSPSGPDYRLIPDS
jgi:hypothetical protein